MRTLGIEPRFMADTVFARGADDLYFRARTTQMQFAALARRCMSGRLHAELACLPFWLRLRAASGADPSFIAKWLKNGWNTELLLRQNLSALDGDALRNSLQWAFPQAYYAAYTVSLAFFNAAGFTESAHGSVIAKQARLASTGCYPKTLCFAADGGRTRVFRGLDECALESPLHYDPKSPANVDTHLRRFLNATRDDDLRARRNDMRKNFKTKKGQPKKALTPADWEEISLRHGPTGLLSLLYRKRIKANYRDIDTFLSDDLDARQLYGDLICVTASLNVVHEAFIAKALGFDVLRQVAEPLVPKGHDFLTMRLANIRKLKL